MKQLIFIGLFLFIIAASAEAGPPYDTDDPEPVEFKHWEVYCSSRPVHDNDGWSGTAPHFEVNYGALPELQLHVIAPLAFNAPNNSSTNYGISDAEVGVKYRFMKETSTLPQIGIFPLVDMPTGNQSKGLGSGNTQVFIPVWLQKSFGKWTTYGGTGYWINPGTGNKNWWFTGWQIQKQVTNNFNIGVEVYHTTEKSDIENADTRFNLGMNYDVTEHHHILFSAGRSFSNSVLLQGYIGYQLTFGPKK